MSTDAFWSDPEMFQSGDFIKFDVVGDTVTGTITAVRKHMFEDGKVVPQIELDTADGPKTLTAGQVRLKASLAEKRPGVGDLLTVTLTGIEKRAGGKTLKEFSVVVGPVAQPAAPVAAAPVADPQPTIDVAALTPEQKAALKGLL
jgi:hypothetical protein